MTAPWPLDAVARRVDAVRAVPTRTGSSRPRFMRRVVAERLAITPDEINAGHCVALSRPDELAHLLTGMATTAGR